MITYHRGIKNRCNILTLMLQNTLVTYIMFTLLPQNALVTPRHWYTLAHTKPTLQVDAVVEVGIAGSK